MNWKTIFFFGYRYYSCIRQFFTSQKESFRKNIETNHGILMIKLKMKNYNTFLTEKQQKYQHYHKVKFINFKILQEKRYYCLIKVEYKNRLSLHILHSVKHLKKKIWRARNKTSSNLRTRIKWRNFSKRNEK